ncbi:MAG: hypothetical protein PHR47_02535 [Candidatus Pacebacteria bacterium]|nr:hypothetical protein [Candidatus Paceibacterota bacterium]
MFNHIWSIICQNSSVDSQSNTISLFNCLENINVEISKSKDIADKIMLPIQFDVVSYWTIDDNKEEKSFTLKMEVIKPNGEVVIIKENAVFAKAGWDKIRNIVKFSGLELGINDSGRYIIRLSQKEKDSDGFIGIANLPLDIKINLNK